MVQANEVEREEMRKQEKIASMFKFGKMAKKHVFMPSLHTREEIHVEYIKSYDNKIPYTEGRAREALIFPKKVKDYTKEWDLAKTCDGNFFQTPVGQEFDKYDDVLMKFMKSQDRGLPRPKPNIIGECSIKIPKETTFLKGTKGVFLTTDIWPAVLTDTKPLLDRTNTPRGALRSTTLDRNYTNKKWLYAKNICEDFNPDISKKEVERSKRLRKIQRREDKEKNQDSMSW